MKDRIKELMDREGLSPSAFADKLGIGRAVMSHILTGRNNPSLDVVAQILTKFEFVNSDWLILNKGPMILSDAEGQNTSKDNIIRSTDLFSEERKSPGSGIEEISRRESSIREENKGIQKQGISPIISEEIKNRRENELEKNEKSDNSLIDSIIEREHSDKRRVTKIIIYYNDSRFEVFELDKKPL